MGRKRKQDDVGCGGAILLLLAIVAAFNYIYEFVIQNIQIVLFFLVLLGVIFGLSAVLSVATKVKHSKAKKRAEFEFTRDLIIAKINGLKQTRAKVIEDEKRIHALKLADVDYMEGSDFEHYVGKLLAHRGFNVEVTPSSNDLGVDIVAEKGGLKYAIQVKRQSKPVSRRAVSDAVAGRTHYHCSAAMVITNNYYTKGARKLAQSTGCELIDKDTLADWVLEFQGSKEVIESAEIVKLDTEIDKGLSRLAELEKAYGYQTAISDGSAVQSRDDKIHVNTKTTSQSFSSFTASQRLILFMLGIICFGIFSCLTILIFSWIS